MKKARTRSVAAGAIAALCLLPLAACGSDTTSSGDEPDTLTKANFAETVAGAMEEEKSAHMTMDMAGMKGEGDFEYDGAETVMQMSMSQGAQEMKMILADGVMYMQAEGMAPPGKWVRIDKDTPMLGEMLGQLDGMTPSAQVEAMEKGLKKVKYVGESTIDGDKVHEYEVTADPKVIAEANKLPTTSMPETITYTMFLTEDHLLRRMETELAGQSVEMEMTDWGKPVDVTAPPAGDVVEFQMPGQPSAQ